MGNFSIRLFGVVACSLGLTSAKAEIVEVAADASIQAAIDAAEPGTVLALKGSNYEIVSELTLSKGITLLGADDASSVVITNTSGTSRVMTIGHADAVVSGVTLTGGVSADHGGGVYMTKGVLTNCVVRGNRVSVKEKCGGGVCLYPNAAGDVRVVDCVISGNEGTKDGKVFGGGIAGKSSSDMPEVVNCTISSNKVLGANSCGAGACYVTLKDCVVEQNVNSGQNSYGGGICNCVAYRCIIRDNKSQGASDTGMGSGARGATCYDCLFTGNYSKGKFTYDGTVQAGNYYNCTIVSNTCSAASVAGAGYTTASQTKLYNCVVADNYVENGGALANYRAGNEPICFNTAIAPIGVYSPLRANAGVSADDPKLNDDFTLGLSSWCVDAGSDGYVVDADRPTDLAGNPRKVGLHVDLGCYEKQTVVEGELSVSVDSLMVMMESGASTSVSANVVAPTGASVTLVWDFGDGTDPVETTCTGAGCAQEAQCSHVFAVSGSFDLTVTAKMSGVDDVVASVADKVRVLADGDLFVSPTDGSDLYSGLSESEPKRTLLNAARSARSGATITLLAGTHELTEMVVLENGVTVVGREGAVVSGNGAAISLDGGATLKSVTFDAVTSSDSLIKLKHGTLRDCVFKNVTVGDNTRLLDIEDLNKNCLIDTCRFQSITCGYICYPATQRESYQFRDCTFVGCTIKQYGLQKCNLYRCAFMDNSSVNCIIIESSAYDCLLLRNMTGDSDNAALIRNGTSVNCTLAFNTSISASRLAYVYRSGTHNNDLVYCNTNQNGTAMTLAKRNQSNFSPTLNNCWVESSPEVGYYVAGTYPCVVGADARISEDGRLRSGSPCIDAGKMDYYSETYKSANRAFDAFGVPRVKSASIDIGCSEAVASGLTLSVR